MIRIERDPGFWMRIANHPEVAGPVLHGAPLEMIGIMAMAPTVTPLAAEHGGFLFRAMDGFGTVQELHTLFLPEGWGREVLQAAKEAADFIFRTAQVLVTHEQEGAWRSRPPKSQGWRVSGDGFAQTPIGGVRAWVLTRDNWLSSPMARRGSD